MLKHVLVRHVLWRMPEHITGNVPRLVPNRVFKHLPAKHIPKHVLRYVLEHVPQNRLLAPATAIGRVTHFVILPDIILMPHEREVLEGQSLGSGEEVKASGQSLDIRGIPDRSRS